MRKPSTPGEILQEEYILPYSLTNAKLAKLLNVDPGTLSRLINGKNTLTPEMALRLAKVFGTTPMFWINLQTTYDIFVAQQNKAFVAEIQKLKPYFKHPITENRNDDQIDT